MENQGTEARRLLIVNKSQAPYFKYLYESLAEELRGFAEITLIVPDKHREGLKVHRFKRELVIPAAKNLECREIQVSGFGGKRAPNFLPNWSLKREIWKFRPDWVWVHEFSPFVLPAVAYAIMKRRPLLVSTELGRENIRDFPGYARRMHRLLGRFVAGIIANSPHAMQPLMRVPEDRVVRAFHSVDSAVYVPIGKDFSAERPLQLVFLGQLIERKGLDLLFGAVKKRIEAGDTLRVRLIGRSNDGWAERLVDSMGLGEVVEFSGFLEGENLVRSMAESDVFVLPSRYDTYGAVTHEAACLGLPLVISRNAGSKALVQEGKNGFVIDPADTEAFAARLGVFQDRNLLRKFSDASRRIAEDYATGSCARRIRSLLETTPTVRGGKERNAALA